ncbi:MAG: M20/M25/M40 family metallo-hydrolase, partial [Mailhella sp.]|nr:M20/M25/M40 family metallo-hydrolase [Mailhella sp.]
MLEFTHEGMLALTKELVAIPSVSHTAGENDCARHIHSLLSQEDFFRGHPDFLRLLPVEKGGLERLAVLAFVPAGQATERTVLLNGHFDVVDTDVCGDLAQSAFDADAYTRLIAGRDMPGEAREDLESGNWLFGRGVMDMKSGLAMYMCFLAHMARHRSELGVNLLFLAVPDEEGNSAGMRGALPGLCSFIRECRLDLIAALSGEPAFWTSRSSSNSEPARIFYTGTTGKIMPMFFCVGREAHVGYSFDGVNAAALAAQTVCLMDCHPELMDGTGPDTLTPPVCLKMKDLRDSYSVTLPERAVSYFNVLT